MTSYFIFNGYLHTLKRCAFGIGNLGEVRGLRFINMKEKRKNSLISMRKTTHDTAHRIFRVAVLFCSILLLEFPFVQGQFIES